jgi:hypothetical protein
MARVKYEEGEDIRFSFFQRGRRLIRLDHIVQQVGGSKKKSQRITVFHTTIPLIAPLEGFPAFIQAAYEAVEKEGSFVSKAPLGDFKLQGITIEFFSTEKSKAKDRLEILTNLTLYDFVVEQEAKVSMLRFKFKVQENRRGFNLWLKHGMTDGLWGEFTPTDSALKQGDGVQMSLTGDNGASEEDEEEEEYQEEDDMPNQDEERAAAVAGD